MRASYPAYSATIRPDARLRALVFASGIALTVAGALAVISLPVDPALRLAMAAAWTAFTVLTLVRQHRRALSVHAYRLYADGSLDLLDVDGARSGRLLAGSVVCEHVGWLRVGSPDGCVWAELVRGNPRKNKEWRRLQVIFRHRSA